MSVTVAFAVRIVGHAIVRLYLWKMLALYAVYQQVVSSYLKTLSLVWLWPLYLEICLVPVFVTERTGLTLFLYFPCCFGHVLPVERVVELLPYSL